MKRPTRHLTPSFRPSPDALEGRHLLSATGLDDQAMRAAISDYLRCEAIVTPPAAWAAGGVLTYSFAPDGTDVGGVPSNLDQAMAALGIASADWEAQFDRAAAIWGAATGVQFVRVPDDGEPIGSPAAVGGDPRFGDIRIAGIAQAGQWLAGTFVPPPDNRGTMTGDIVMNTAKPWVIDADGIPDIIAGEPIDPAAFDLLTVALHELGHDLGVGHLFDPASVGYEDYNGIKHALTSDDIAHVTVDDGPTTSQAVIGPIAGEDRSSTFTLHGAGDSYTADLVVDTAGFFEISPRATGGPVRVTLTGDDGAVTLEPGRGTLEYLAAGRYRVRVEDAGAGPVSGSLAVITPDYEADSLLANGIRQAPAASFRILTTAVPAAGSSAFVAGAAAAPIVSAPPGPAAAAVVEVPAFAVGFPTTLGGPVGRPTMAADHMIAVGPGTVARAHNRGGLPGLIALGTDARAGDAGQFVALATERSAGSRPREQAMAEDPRDSGDRAVLAEAERMGPGLAAPSESSDWSPTLMSGDPVPDAMDASDPDRTEAAGLPLPLVAAVIVPPLVLRYRRRLAAWLRRDQKRGRR